MHSFIQFLIDSVSLGSLNALLALGIAVVFSIMGLVNFAHSEIIMAGGYTLVVVSSAGDVSRIIVLLLICIITALLMERLAFRPLRGAQADTLLVASFAVSFFVQSLAIMIFGSLPRQRRPV